MERLNGEIGWRDRARMRDERHIVNTSCPGHIPDMAGNKNQIKLWCLQYIFYKQTSIHICTQTLYSNIHNGPSQTFIMHFKEPTGYIIRKKYN